MPAGSERLSCGSAAPRRPAMGAAMSDWTLTSIHCHRTGLCSPLPPALGAPPPARAAQHPQKPPLTPPQHSNELGCSSVHTSTKQLMAHLRTPCAPWKNTTNRGPGPSGKRRRAGSLLFHIEHSRYPDKGKLAERRGRKAMDLRLQCQL